MKSFPSDVISGIAALFLGAVQEAMSKQQVATGPEGAERLGEKENRTEEFRARHLHKHWPGTQASCCVEFFTLKHTQDRCDISAAFRSSVNGKYAMWHLEITTVALKHIHTHAHKIKQKSTQLPNDKTVNTQRPSVCSSAPHHPGVSAIPFGHCGCEPRGQQCTAVWEQPVRLTW